MTLQVIVEPPEILAGCSLVGFRETTRSHGMPVIRSILFENNHVYRTTITKEIETGHQYLCLEIRGQAGKDSAVTVTGRRASP